MDYQADEAHQGAAAAVSARTREFFATKTPYRVYHGSTNCTRPSQRRADNTVDTSGLNRVLAVDTAAKTVVAEPNVPMDALVEATLAHGLVPLVVMEFPGITVGGGFSGTSGESSSFRYGAFDTTVNWIEIVLPNGDVTRASKTDKPDLFWGAASAFGTLGVVTLLEVQLRDAHPFVQLTYRPVSAFAEATQVIQSETAEAAGHDYVDAITFLPDYTLILTGRLVASPPTAKAPVQRFLWARDPWFYMHAERVGNRLRGRRQANGSATYTEYVPLRDYLFRYDRGGFWGARYAFRYFWTPFNRVTRFLLDPFLHTRLMYRALHQSGLSAFYILQDVGIPYDRADEFARWLDANLGLYPLWLCPLTPQRDGGPAARHGLHAEFADADCPLLLNFGVWGPAVSRSDRRACVRQNRALEAKVHELGGKKWLYAHTYYTQDEFWANYDRATYDALRDKYHAAYLPSVYDKVRVHDVDEDADGTGQRGGLRARIKAFLLTVWPLAGLYGACKAIVGAEYLLQKQAKDTRAVQVSTQKNV